MAGVTPPSDSDPTGDRVIITSPEAADMKKAVNDHFQRSIECAMAALASSGGQGSPRQWPGRNLPEAFFSKPPASTKSKTSSNTPLSHSRDGSTDSSGRYTLSPPATATSLSPLVQHSRTHSSPAIISNVQVQANYGQISHQTNPSAVQHQKHRSFDNTLDSDPSMQHIWQQTQYAEGARHQPQQPLRGEKTSKSLGDLVTSDSMGMETGFAMGANSGGAEMNYGEQTARKISCNDPSMMWNNFSAGQNFQKPQQTQFIRQQPRHQTSAVSSVPSGSVRSQILKRQQQQQQLQYQQQCQLQGHAYANPVVQELNQERQRMYERNMQLKQQGLLDPLPTATLPISPSATSQYQTDLASGQYHMPSSSNAPRTQQNPQYHQQHQQAPMFHARQGSSDSGLDMQAYTTYASYMRNPQDMDLNFANISLDPSTLMDVDPSVIPAGPLDIGPDDLDQYLNH